MNRPVYVLALGLSCGLLLLGTSCSRQQSNIAAAPQSSPTPSIEATPESGAGGGMAISDESDACNADPTCGPEKLESTEAEVQRLYDQQLALLGDVVPIWREEVLRDDLVKVQEEWLAFRDSTCRLNVAFSGIGSRPIRGSSLSLVSNSCKIEFNEERIAELSESLDRYKDLPQATSTPVPFRTIKVQELLYDGDYLLSSSEDPSAVGSNILLIRKRGNTFIGFSANIESDGYCFRKLITQSTDQVETVIHDPFTEKFTVEYNNGDLNNSGYPLRHYDVAQLERAGEHLESCEKIFANY